MEHFQLESVTYRDAAFAVGVSIGRRERGGIVPTTTLRSTESELASAKQALVDLAETCGSLAKAGRSAVPAAKAAGVLRTAAAGIRDACTRLDTVTSYLTR